MEPERNILNSLGVLYSKEALNNISDDFDTALMLYDKADFYFKSSKMRDVMSSHPYHAQAYSSLKRGEYYDHIGQTENAYKYYSEALEVIEEAKESIAYYELESIVSLESKIYNEKFGDFNTAKKKLLLFIDNAPHAISGYILMSRFIFNEAKKHRKDPSRCEELFDQTLFYVEEGLRISEKNQDLLKMKYYTIREIEPDNAERIYELLLERYETFDGNCSELKLLFELGVRSFERGEYNTSKTFLKELNEKSYDHPYRSGIKMVAKDSNKEDKKFKGYISKFISKREAYVLSEEIGYAVRFNPFAQKRELRSREDVEFNVAFNYIGVSAINLMPL